MNKKYYFKIKTDQLHKILIFSIIKLLKIVNKAITGV